MKLTYEMLPESAQKAYDQTNKIRKGSMFIAIILSVIFLIVDLVSSKNQGFMNTLFFSFLGGCCIHGLIHSAVLLKSLFTKFLKSLLKIYFPPLMLISAIMLCVGFTFAMFIGAPCMIADLIMYLKKKPLVYSCELGSFLKLKAVQEEIQAMEMQNMRYSQDDVQTKITKLKQMFDDGLITENEYNQKKAELLSNI
ncbi:MAG: SHOCT domain-containing protein [Ruminococcus flavefaciens]|nr:SHOCT domain-containing protein [Ruminococcus flavefaciens]